MLEEEESSNQAKAQIYSFLKNSQNQSLNNKILFARNILLMKGISEENIEEIKLLERDPILPAFLEYFSESDFPITFINGIPIGNITTLQEWETNRKIDLVLSNPDGFSRQYQSLIETIKQYNISLSSSSEGEQLEVVPSSCSNGEMVGLFREDMNKVPGSNLALGYPITNEASSSFPAFSSSPSRCLSSSPSRASNTSPSSSYSYSFPNFSSSSRFGRTSFNAENDNGFPSSWSEREMSEEPGPFFASDSKYLSEHSPLTNGNYMDLAVQTSKWFSENVGMAVGQAVASVSGFLHPNLSDAYPKQFQDARGDSYVEYEVLQLNWYFRYQPRLLRFSKDKFIRMNPQTKEVRAVHKYNELMKIIVRGKTFMTIKFKDPDFQPESYESNYLEQILSTILKNSNEAIPVCYE